MRPEEPDWRDAIVNGFWGIVAVLLFVVVLIGATSTN